MQAAIKEVIGSYWASLVVVLMVIIIIRLTMVFNSNSKKFVLHEEIFNLLFVAYLLILFQLVTAQDIQTYNSTNLVPFREILRYDVGTNSFYRQVIGNILLFIPFGYFVSGYCRIKNLGLISLVTLITSFVIEFTQRFISRSFDVDDIILNLVGGILGFLIYISLNAIRTHLPKFLRRDWFLNLLSVLVLVLGILYLIKIL